MHSWIVVVGKIKSDNSNSGHSHSHSFSGGSAPGSMVAKEGPAKPWQSPFLKPYAFEEAVGTKVVESLHQVPNDAKKKECAVGHDVEAVKVVEKEKNVQYFDSFEDFKSYCCQQIVIEEYKTIPDSSSKGDSTSGASGSGGVDNTLNEQSTSSSYGVATNNYSIRVQVKNNIRHKIEIVIRNGSQA